MIRKLLARVAAWLCCCLLFAPALLIFTVSEDGRLSVWNFVGALWLVYLTTVVKQLKTKRHGNRRHTSAEV